MTESTEKITINVKTQGGASYELSDIDATTTLLEVKGMVAKQAGGLLADSISFLYKGKKLDDDLAPLDEIGVGNNGVLYFTKRLDLDVPLEMPPEVKTMVITVKTSSGTSKTVEGLTETKTILDIKLSICDQSDNLEPDQFKLIFKGKPLTTDSDTLKDVGIVDGSTMFMVVSLDRGPEALDLTTNEDDQPKIVRPDPGLMRFRVPPGGVGRQVRVNPPNGGPPFMVRVPTTSRVGEVMQVRIPGTSPPPPPQVVGGGNTQPQRPNAAVRTNRPNNVPGTQLMQVVCPPNKRPGDMIEINVPTKGRMRVKIPSNATPGQPFYFRVAN